MKGGSPIGVTSHGQCWRGWLGDSSGETRFVIYKPQDGPPVELANRVSANQAYRACTDHNNLPHNAQLCGTPKMPR